MEVLVLKIKSKEDLLIMEVSGVGDDYDKNYPSK